MIRCRICEQAFAPDEHRVTLPLFHPRVDKERDDIWAHQRCLLHPPIELVAKRDEVCRWSLRASMDGDLD